MPMRTIYLIGGRGVGIGIGIVEGNVENAEQMAGTI